MRNLNKVWLGVYENSIYESTGSPVFLPQTRSLFGRLNLKTGNIENYIELDRNIYYGEGSTILNNRIYFLTYKNKLCFVYDLESLKLIKSFKINSEQGWGLTNNEQLLIMSDGTEKLTYIEVNKYSVVKQLTVTYKNEPLMKINDLQYIDNVIYANVYKTKYIVKINTNSGCVEGWIDLGLIVSDVQKNQVDTIGELNGIAYNKISDSFFITGKFWSKIYEIKLIH